MSDSYRPGYGRDKHDSHGMPPHGREGVYHFQGNGGHYPPQAPRGPRNQQPGSRYRNDRHPGGRFAPIHQRPLLRARHDHREETFSPHDPLSKNKFRDVEDLTDSQEENMSESDSDEEQEQRPVKRARLDAPTAPRWSNPDPYTALPPPLSDVTETRMDVVKLIRKAKLEDGQHSFDLDMTNNTDFISFEDIVDDAEEMQSDNIASGPTNLGKRKRHDALARPKRPPSRPLAHNPILSEWRTPRDGNYAPWLSPYSENDSASIA
jgi:non-canonical poly(A) RNA polymerase PAPD5/7